MYKCMLLSDPRHKTNITLSKVTRETTSGIDAVSESGAFMRSNPTVQVRKGVESPLHTDIAIVNGDDIHVNLLFCGWKNST